MATRDLSIYLRGLVRQMAIEPVTRQSDRRLVDDALSGNSEAALAAIVQRHGAMVYRVCWRLLQHDQDAEDAFQATFLVLAQKLRRLRKRESLASWLHGVAVRVSQKARAAAATRRRHERQALAPMAPHGRPAWEDLHSALDAAVAELPEKWRQPLVLCYLEGKTQDEAARQLGWSKNTLRNRLAKARVALGRRLRRHGLGCSASIVLLSDCLASAPRTELVAATVDAATGMAVGKTLSAVASANTALLVQGVLYAMLLRKVAIAAMLVVSLVIGLGACTLAGTLEPLGAAPAAQGPADRPDERKTVIVLASEAPGKIVDLPLMPGDKVKPGDILVRLDDRQAKLDLTDRQARVQAAAAELQAAQAVAKEAGVRADRARDLFGKGAMSVQDWVAARLMRERFDSEVTAKQAALRSAEIDVKQAELALDKQILRSPVEGTIRAFFKNKFETIEARQDLVQILVHDTRDAADNVQHLPTDAQVRALQREVQALREQVRVLQRKLREQKLTR
jgi:RNA polymerase sigma factor (sigma-70 family)